MFRKSLQEPACGALCMLCMPSSLCFMHSVFNSLTFIMTLQVLASLESLEPAGNVTAQACIWVGSSPHLPKLSVIRVNGAATATGLAFLASSDLGQQRLGQLRVLSIDTCKQLQPESLHAALRHCSNLESLTLINCPRLQDSACVLISTCCPKLRKLVLQDLYNLYDDGVAHLARELPYLEELHLVGHEKLTNQAKIEPNGPCSDAPLTFCLIPILERKRAYPSFSCDDLLTRMGLCT